MTAKKLMSTRDYNFYGKGYSTVKILEDNDGYVSFGYGNQAGNNNDVVCVVYFQEFDIYVVIGPPETNQLSRMDPIKIRKTAWSALTRYLHVTLNALNGLLSSVYDNGYVDGVEDTKANIRTSLGIDKT